MQNETSQETKNVTAPYFFYTVATTITRKGYKPQTFHSIVRSNKYSDIRPAMQKAYEKVLQDNITWISRVDAKKLKADFFIYDTNSVINQVESVE